MLSILKKIFSSTPSLPASPIQENESVNLNISKLIDIEMVSVRDKRLKKIISTLDECSSDDLNYLVAELLKVMGYEARVFDGINDRGIDVVGVQDGKMMIAVQCKAWNPKRNTERISVKDVQAFKGQFITEYEHGLFITTHYFTGQSWEEASDRYHLIDRKKLFGLIGRYFPQHLSSIRYQETLSTLSTCGKCNSGKLIKLFSQKKTFYYWCESCEENSYS